MKSETIAALRGAISTLLKNRADFSLTTYEFLPEQQQGNNKNRPNIGQECTKPREKSGPPYRIRDVTNP